MALLVRPKRFSCFPQVVELDGAALSRGAEMPVVAQLRTKTSHSPNNEHIISSSDGGAVIRIDLYRWAKLDSGIFVACCVLCCSVGRSKGITTSREERLCHPVAHGHELSVARFGHTQNTSDPRNADNLRRAIGMRHSVFSAGDRSHNRTLINSKLTMRRRLMIYFFYNYSIGRSILSFIPIYYPLAIFSPSLTVVTQIQANIASPRPPAPQRYVPSFLITRINQHLPSLVDSRRIVPTQ